jgi:hypothetical protein
MCLKMEIDIEDFSLDARFQFKRRSSVRILCGKTNKYYPFFFDQIESAINVYIHKELLLRIMKEIMAND